MKVKALIAALLLLSAPIFAIAPGENVIEHILFLDFPEAGSAFIENPLKTGAILAGLTAGTAVLINNDLWLSRGLSAYQDKNKDIIYDVANNFGDPVYIMAGCAVLYALNTKSERELSAKILEGIAVTGTVGFVLKSAIGRERPSVTDNPKSFFHSSFKDMSFPSGHTATVFTVAAIIPEHYKNPWLYAATVPLASLTAAARIYKNKHWVSDTLAGAALGIFTGCVIETAHERFKTELTIEKGFGCDITMMKYRF